MYSHFFKRIFDFAIALFFGLFFLPIMLVICILVRINMGGSAIFKQQRIGKDEKPFWIYKIKTMNDKKDENGKLLPDEERITKLGAFLRKTSLDEIPQLFNVLKGDMSVVGPRPFMFETLPYYSEKERKRHSVLPGITGLAQVNGRNSITFKEKYSYDLEYVAKITFWIDIKILFRTLLVLLSASGVVHSEESKFKYDDDENKD